MSDELAFLSWPDDVQALIDELQTVEGLDALCCAASTPSRSWSFDEIVASTGHDRLRVTEALVHLVGKGLLEVSGWQSVRYAHPTPAIDSAVSKLMQLSDEDRPNVLGAIAHCSIWRIRSSIAEALARRRPRAASEH